MLQITMSLKKLLKRSNYIEFLKELSLTKAKMYFKVQ